MALRHAEHVSQSQSDSKNKKFEQQMKQAQELNGMLKLFVQASMASLSAMRRIRSSSSLLRAGREDSEKARVDLVSRGGSDSNAWGG